MVLLGDEAHVRVVLVRLETELTFTQIGARFCAERTIGLEIILDAPDGTPR